MKILLLGKTGQVGRELQIRLGQTDSLVALGSKDENPSGNLANLDGLARTIRDLAPDVIINAAAYTAVDKAESERDLARLVNAEAPAVLAHESKKIGALLVHYSTDYVFDGSGETPWRETDTPAPLNVYGATKLEGDCAIQASGCRALIFRTSWVHAAQGTNFIQTILRLAKERETLNVVNDQIGAPASADLLADATLYALRHGQIEGLFHLTAKGETSWHAYARFIVETAQRAGATLKLTPEAIAPIPSSAFPTPARRPLNSRLNLSKFEESFAISLPDWQEGVARTLAKILSQ